MLLGTKLCEEAPVELVGGMWCACSSSISPCAAATAAFYCLGVCSICIGSGVMSRDSGSRLGWWSVHPIVVRARLISFIRLVHCLILSSHMSRQIEVIKFSTSNTPVYCIFDGNLIKIVYHPHSLVSPTGHVDTSIMHLCMEIISHIQAFISQIHVLYKNKLTWWKLVPCISFIPWNFLTF